MANYAVTVLDNGDGTWDLAGIFRAPAAFASGGTNLNTITTSTGFQQAATTTSDGLGHRMRSPLEVLARAQSIIAMDRSFNGN